MLDRWNTDNGDGFRSEIMEGPHGGSGRSFSEEWSEMTWGDRTFFVFVVFVIVAALAGAIAILAP